METKDQIAKELRESNGPLERFLNNFTLSFSNNGFRAFNESMILKGKMSIEEHEASLEKTYQNSSQDISDLKRSLTRSQWFYEIDRAVEEEKKDVEALLYMSGSQLADYVFPVYVNLRKKGFSHFDLTE